MFHFKHSSQLAAVGLAALLAACGGGGGSSSSNPATPVTANSTINAGNQTSVAGLGYASLSSMNGQVALSSLATGVNVSPAIGGAGLLDTLIATSYQALNASPKSLVTGIATTQTLTCSNNGTLQVSLNQSVANSFSNGDNFSFVGNNCAENGTTINGSYSMSFNNISGTSTSTGNWTGTLSVVLSNLSIQVGSAAAIVMNGDMNIGFTQNNSQIRYAVSGNSLSANSSGTTISMSNYAYTGSRSGSTYTYQANFTETVSSASLGTISYTVTTTTPFVQTTGSNPTQGAFTVKASDNTSIIVTVVATGVQVQLDATGSGNYGVATTVPWASL